MTPGFFGPKEEQLLGLYTPPRGKRLRDVGVLFCCPAPQEYMRSHWAYRKLATQLSKEGFHIFRFDYFATGDSAGDSTEVSLQRWREDIRRAIQEFRDVASISKVSLLGFRLGATLAASIPQLAVRDLILWEPVVAGTTYVDEHLALHRRELERHLTGKWPSRSQRFDELLGFPFPAPFESDLRRIDLSSQASTKAERYLVFAAEDTPPFRRLESALSLKGPTTFHHVPDETSTEAAATQAALLSNRALDAITAELSQR